MSKLVIVVPTGRSRCGRAVLLGNDGKTRLAPFRVLATASEAAAVRFGNPKREWRRPFGDSPTGTYVVAGSLPPGVMPKAKKRSWRFGRFGALILSPVAGDALVAARAGRTRFLLHGGATDSIGRLRPTYGGFRVADADLRALLAAVNNAFTDDDPVSAVEVAETATPSWLDDGPLDQTGSFNPVKAPAASTTRGTRTVNGSVSVTRTALLALGFGIVARGSKKAVKGGVSNGEVDRRDFVGLAFLTIGALGTEGCSPSDDPVPDPHACTENPCRHFGNDDAGIAPTSLGTAGLGTAGVAGTGRDAGTDARSGGDDGGGPLGGYDGGYADGAFADGDRPDGRRSATGSAGTAGTGTGATGGVGTGGVGTGGVGTGGVGTGGTGTTTGTGDSVPGTTGDSVTGGTTGDGFTGTTGDGFTGTTGDGFTGTTGDGFTGTTGDGTGTTGDGTGTTGDGTGTTGDGTGTTGDGTGFDTGTGG